MSTYQAPLRDMQFVLKELAGIDDVAKLPGFEEAADWQLRALDDHLDAVFLYPGEPYAAGVLRHGGRSPLQDSPLHEY